MEIWSRYRPILDPSESPAQMGCILLHQYVQLLVYQAMTRLLRCASDTYNLVF